MIQSWCTTNFTKNSNFLFCYRMPYSETTLTLTSMKRYREINAH